jgi:nickel-dependent lactate racemase
MKKISLKYGREGQVSFEIDPRRIVAHHCGPAPCTDLAGKLRAALSAPLDFPSLVQVCVPGDKVVLALDRHTPASADIVAAVWDMLDARGVNPADWLVLQPVALDRIKLTDPRSLLPDSVRQEVQWKVHDPTDKRGLAYLAATARGERIYLARELVDADVVLSAGVTAYDSLLGYRGACSVFYPGLSNTEAISRTRGEGHAELGPDDERPLRQSIDEIAWLLGSQFSIQVLPATGGGVAEVLAGTYEQVFRKGKQLLGKTWRVTLNDRAEMVVATVAADNTGHSWEQVGAALATARNLVESGGKIVLLSEFQGELDIGIELIRQNQSPRDALAPIRKQAPVDMLPATQFAMAADWAHVYLMSQLSPTIVEDLFMVPIANDREFEKLLSGHETCAIVEGAEHTYGSVRQA